LLASNASANPIAFVLANSEAAPESPDPAASNVHEAAGEPAIEGELDAADLSKLGGRLASIALAYESFRDASSLDADVKLLVDYTSPKGLIPNPADRVQTLDRVYRALSLLDDTQALRYPEGEGCAREHRLALLRSSDGLFSDPKTRELAPWLKAEFKRSKANDAPGGLIAASAREWTALGYLKSLAEVRNLSLRLGDGRILGAPRAAAYCRRAKLYEELAAAQSALGWSDPGLTAQTKAVVEVRWGKERGAGTVILLGGKAVVLVSGRLTENVYEAPDLFTKSGKKLSASYLRRGPALSLLTIQTSPEVEPLAIPEIPEPGERVAYAVGHPIQGGPWSVTRGLALPAGALIRTDAAIDGAQAGGPVFDAQGRLIGIVAAQGVAYDLAAIKNWLADENAKLPEDASAQESGTGALLTASSTIAPEEKGGLIESGSSFNSNPTGVCVDARGCGMPSAPYGGGSDYSAPYSGPNLWSMLGKLLKPAPKLFSGMFSRKETPAPTVAGPPKLPYESMYDGTAKEEKKPDPTAARCKLERLDPPKEISPGEKVTLSARFTCDKLGAPLGGHKVRFTLGWSGTAIQGTYEAFTDDSGLSTFTFEPELMAGEPAPVAAPGQQLAGQELAAVPNIASPETKKAVEEVVRNNTVLFGVAAAIRSVATVYVAPALMAPLAPGAATAAAVTIIVVVPAVSFTMLYKGYQAQKKYDKAIAEFKEAHKDVLEPPGDCTKQRFKELDIEVGRKCKSLPRSCKEEDVEPGDCPELELRLQRNQECVSARQQLMDECFRGGDARHNRVRNDEVKAREYCRKRIKDECP
jgi:hypothetical protein